MPAPVQPANRPPTRRALSFITLGVLLAHAALLNGAPLNSAVSGNTAAERPFITRTITDTAAAPSVSVTTPRSNTPAAAVRTLAALPANTRSAATAPIFPVEQSQPTVNTTHVATETIANLPRLDTGSVQLASAVTSSGGADAPSSLASQPAAGTPTLHLALPGSARLKYAIKGEVKGFPYAVNGELLWVQDGKTYEARLEVSHFLLGSRVQTSKGELTPQGLAPTRFGDKVRSEVAAHFERAKGKISFSANSPDVALQVGAQDQVSVFLQLSTMLGGDPTQYPTGSRLQFQTVTAKFAEQWVFVVGASELLDLPGGSVKAIKLTREPSLEYDSRAEIWLAPEMAYLPVRIRLTQANGDFADQLWRATEKP